MENIRTNSFMEPEMQEFTQEELAACNGENDEKVYVAHKGKVYDVSGSKMWKGGTHMKRHKAGSDLSTDIQAAPHEPDVLERYPQVGVLKKEGEAGDVAMPPILSRLLLKFPMLRRHPHPMTVHFPIAFMFGALLFAILYLVTGISAFDTTVFHCLSAGLFFTVVAMATGWYTWWLNYGSHKLRAVQIKKRVSIALAGIAGAGVVLRAAVPDILLDFRGITILYLAIVLLVFLLVTIIGWYGASLTFPVEKE